MGEIPDRAFHSGGVARINGTQVDAERRRNGLNGSKFTDAGEFARVANDRVGAVGGAVSALPLKADIRSGILATAAKAQEQRIAFGVLSVSREL
jgi:hypothetical protein